MPYLSQNELSALGLRYLGVGVKVSTRAALYETEKMSFGDNCRIDDFCVVSGCVELGRNVQVSVFCNVAAGAPGIVLEDFSTLAYGVHLFAQSDDYSGRTMTNPTVPALFKKEIWAPIRVGRHAIIGAQACVFPGANIAEGCAVGAGAVVTKPTDPWGIYVGNPARRLKDRARDLLELEKQFLALHSEARQ